MKKNITTAITACAVLLLTSCAGKSSVETSCADKSSIETINHPLSWEDSIFQKTVELSSIRDSLVEMFSNNLLATDTSAAIANLSDLTARYGTYVIAVAGIVAENCPLPERYCDSILGNNEEYLNFKEGKDRSCRFVGEMVGFTLWNKLPQTGTRAE